MMRRLFYTILLAACPAFAQAEPIPGADDPVLQATAQAWLDGDDPAGDLYALALIAEDGNVAAQELVSRIWYRHVQLDFPDLDRGARRALLPETVQERSHSSSPRWIESKVPLARKARGRIHDAETFQAWRADAEVLLAAGLRDELAVAVRIAPGNRPDIDIEVIQFAETVFGPNDPINQTLYAARLMGMNLQDYRAQFDIPKYAARRARWDGDPWTPQIDARFRRALEEQRWTAIRALGLARNIPGLPVSFSGIPDHITRWADASYSYFDTPALSGSDLEALGEALVDDSTRTHQLAPLLRNCELYCTEKVASCMAKSAIAQLGAGILETPLEPVISSERFFRSDRAARMLLMSTGYREGNAPPDLPNCLLEPAIAAYQNFRNARP